MSGAGAPYKRSAGGRALDSGGFISPESSQMRAPGQMEFAWGMVQRIVKAYDDFYSKNKRDKR